MIGIVGAAGGNVRSVSAAFAASGHEVEVSTDPNRLAEATHLVVPGQGAFAQAMTALERSDCLSLLRDAIRREVPYLGICLGLQILFDESEEGGPPGLGVLSGKVVRFRATAAEGPLKVPHMGWNQLEEVRAEGPFERLHVGSWVYFVHSYFAVPSHTQVIASRATHGHSFVAAVASGRIFATQFHPEKSGRAGLQLCDSFARLRP